MERSLRELLPNSHKVPVLPHQLIQFWTLPRVGQGGAGIGSEDTKEMGTRGVQCRRKHIWL